MIKYLAVAVINCPNRSYGYDIVVAAFFKRASYHLGPFFLSNIYSMNIHIYSKRVQMPLLDIVWDHGMGAILFRRSMYFELIEFLNVQNYIL